jgi:hypothetical protein
MIFILSRVRVVRATKMTGSGFDNSIYWIFSHVVTTIRYYTFKLLYLWHTNNYNTLKVNTSTTELSWRTSSWRIPSDSLHCFLYRLGTDHIENTLTTEPPWTTTSWRIPSDSLQCFLYRLGTYHIENTASIVDDTSLLLVVLQWKALFLFLVKNFSSRERVYLAVP